MAAPRHEVREADLVDPAEVAHHPGRPRNRVRSRVGRAGHQGMTIVPFTMASKAVKRSRFVGSPRP
jgi:hypothetical protein